ncbi:gamma-glutamylcyclotransferase [Puniceicoccales bacterium CK1056]|uniref:Gamma-glutamylcyclotransferase n=1 Tax=Oceanipulchritudo coccoides TaxID=2706888 RepID=A0A6B2M2J7_9BACT|nr:gamma-glutamylcyclotransferase family protein [Oceanipulchritudo coccoides]NDV61940.1 gamma-glutamylcyclotransferase [Oceanipulchritudo coccoides]
MERLFSYGTLQQENVQLETFGRKLFGIKDALPGYTLEEIAIKNPEVIKRSGKIFHPMLRKSGNPNDAVQGTVFEITQAELMKADQYEVDDYKRVMEMFRSGFSAWVYIDSQQLTEPTNSGAKKN